MLAVTCQQIGWISSGYVQRDGIGEAELVRQLEAGWQYAGNLVQLAIQLHLATEDIGVRTELLVPKLMADDGLVITSGAVLFGQKLAPPLRTHAKHRE